MSKRDELVAYVASLTPEQVDKLFDRLPLLKQLPRLSENQLIFTEEFLKRIFPEDEEA